MSTRLQTRVSIAALVVVGAGASLWSGYHLLDSQELNVPLNPLGINRSPYGQVFAMALQGPINKNFHVGMYGATPEEIEQRKEENAGPIPDNRHTAEPDLKGSESEAEKPSGLLDRMQSVIDDMNTAHARRTNKLPASPTLKFYIRREAEDKLRFAYQLDPSHYANYAALHFFMVEGLTTRPELKAGAGKLAQETIDYCLSISHDPRPALTAAAACTNILHIMFNAQRLSGEEQYSIEEMEAMLRQLDVSISTYQRIAEQWDENGNWERISPQRIQACEQRIHFISQIREAAVKTIERIRASRSN